MKFRGPSTTQFGSADPLIVVVPASSFTRLPELLLYSVAPLATLVTAPLLARGLGPVARGQYGVATVIGMFAITLGAWGQAEIYLGEAGAGRFSVLQQSRITWVCGSIFGLLTATALIALSIPLSTSVLTAIWVPLLAQANVWRSVCVAFGHLKQPALYNALGSVIRVGALMALAWTTILNVDTAVTATQAALAISALVTMWLVVRRVPTHYDMELVPIPLLLRGGGSIITFSVLNAITLRSDVVILALFVTPHDVGLYAAPASLTTAALALSAGFKSRLQAAAFSTHAGTSVAREVLPLLVLSIVGAVALWFTAPQLVQVFFGRDYSDSVVLLRLLGIATVPLLMLDLAQGLLIVLARRKQLVTLGALGASSVVIALVIFCPGLGATGAAVACIVGYGIAAAIAWLALVRDLVVSRRAA